MNPLLTVIFCLLLLTTTTACDDILADLPSETESVTHAIVADESGSAKEAAAFEDVLEFDGLEIVFSDGIEWVTIDNSNSDHGGAVVFLVPVAIKNVSDDTHRLNSLFYKQYGTSGLELDGVGAYFEGEVGLAGYMRPGATQDTFMAFLYDGDGDYYVEFVKLVGTPVEARLPIVKG